MSDVISKKCDCCLIVKTEVNGWWFLAADADGVYHMGHNGTNNYAYWKIHENVDSQFNNMLVRNPKVIKFYDLCGVGCLLKMITILESMKGS